MIATQKRYSSFVDTGFLWKITSFQIGEIYQFMQMIGFLQHKTKCLCIQKWDDLVGEDVINKHSGIWQAPYCWWQPEIRLHNQLRLVVYSIVYRGFIHPTGGWPWDFFHQQSRHGSLQEMDHGCVHRHPPGACTESWVFGRATQKGTLTL